MVEVGTTIVSITSPNLTTPQWSLITGNPISWSVNPQTRRLQFNLPINGSAIFRLTANTSCGQGVYDFLFIAESSNLRINPNPVSSALNVNLEENKELDFTEITIADRFGTTQLNKKYSVGKKSDQINLIGMKAGLYYITVKTKFGYINKSFIKVD